MIRITKYIKSKLDELEHKIMVENANKTISEEHDLITKILESKYCEDYKKFMRNWNENADQSMLDKHPDNEKEIIKDAWMMEVEYEDIFEQIARTRIEEKSHMEKN